MSRKVLALMLILTLSLTMVVSASAAEKYTIHVLSIWSESDTSSYGHVMKQMLDDFCATHDGFDYEYEYCEQAQVPAKLSVLMASNDVPDLFIYEPGSAMNALIDANVVVNLTQEFQNITGHTLEEVMAPGALSSLDSVSQYDDVYYLCTAAAFETLLYNKTLFAELGIEVPQTWEDLEAACDKLLASNITPIGLGNSGKWQLTRWLMLLEARLGGHDAHLRASINDGIRFDDDIFVRAATELQQMAQKGYFGIDYNSLNMTDVYSMFLTGKCGIIHIMEPDFHFLRDDSEGNIGLDEIGYFFPGTLEGSSISQEEAQATFNVAPLMAVCLGQQHYEEGKNAEFLSFFLTKFGDYQVKNGMSTAYNPNFLTETSPVARDLLDDLSAEAMSKIKYSTLWREAYMTTELTSLTQDNAQLLAEGSMTPEEYCSEAAAVVDELE